MKGKIARGYKRPEKGNIVTGETGASRAQKRQLHTLPWSRPLTVIYFMFAIKQMKH